MVKRQTKSKRVATDARRAIKASKLRRFPLPKNKLGRFAPGFIKNSWGEIRQVTWPGRRETMRLTMAVFIFSVIFGAFVAVLDFGLDKLFKQVILK